MKQLLIALLLLGYFGSGVQAAGEEEKKYAGIFYSEAESDFGNENKNYLLVVGANIKSGFGMEFFYSDTVDKDEARTTAGDIRFSTQAWGLLGTYRVGSKFYGVAKVGYTFADLKVEVAGQDSATMEEDGFSYGVGFGIEVGEYGAIELNYLVLPEMELIVPGVNMFIGLENELTSIGYNWYF